MATPRRKTSAPIPPDRRLRLRFALPDLSAASVAVDIRRQAGMIEVDATEGEIIADMEAAAADLDYDG